MWGLNISSEIFGIVLLKPHRIHIVYCFYSHRGLWNIQIQMNELEAGDQQNLVMRKILQNVRGKG